MHLVSRHFSASHFLGTSLPSNCGVQLLPCRRLMDAPRQTRIERRSAQRFNSYQIAVTLRTLDGRTGSGFTLDLSSRGALVWTDLPLHTDEILDMTLVMPSEITLAEQMNVRCRARVMRMQGDQGKLAVAVKIEHYDFLPRELTSLQQHAGAGLHVSRA